MLALVFDRFGGPDVLRIAELPDPVPSSNEVIVATRAIGLNFADVYRRRGDYHLAGTPPYIAGYEAAGEVVRVGADVSSLRVGARVGIVDVPFCNAELVRVPETHAIPLPDAIPFELAAALLLQGLTAQYLVEDSYRVEPGCHVLVQAAAGGVGQLVVQLARSRGARVLGIVSRHAKVFVAEAAGAERVLLRSEAWVEEARRWSAGGVDVTYDAVGTTLLDSLRVLRDRGTAVFFGMAGGDPPAIPPRMLMDRSLTLVGGDLWSYLTSAGERQRRAQRLFEAVVSGTLRASSVTRFPLRDGALAHALLESGTSDGKVVLIP
jgi:NADPH:quinone reductase